MAEKGDHETVDWRDKVNRFSTWRAEMSAEAAMLPQTLADLRTTIQDLRKVSARLEQASMGIETALKLAESSRIAPIARQFDAAANEMEAQLRAINEQVPAGDLMGKAVADLQRTFNVFSSLLPRPRSEN